MISHARNTSRLEKADRVNLFYILEEHAKSKYTANRVFLVFEGKEWTYAETYDIVLQYAAWLKTSYAVAPGEIVALDFMNSPQFVFLWMAIWSLGATPSFINYNLTGPPLLHCLKASSARIVLVEEEVEPRFTNDVREKLSSTDFRDDKGPVEIVSCRGVEGQITQLPGHREPDLSRSGPAFHDMGILVFTSGTTGLPKPAIVSWSKLHVSAKFLTNWMGLRTSDRYYTCMPLYHSTATILAYGPVIGIGATLVLGRKFSHKTFWPEVRASKSTVIQYVGETCRYLLAAPPQTDPNTGENLDQKHSVRVAFGNGLRPDIWERFKTRFNIETIAEFYSATESASASWNLSSNPATTGAIGRAGSIVSFLLRSSTAVVEMDLDTELPLRDPNNKNFCRRVPRGEPGELLYKLDPADIKKNFQGYFGNQKATDSKVLRDVFANGDAWFRTGDLIRWDSDGRFFFVDRIGDTFRWRSENVSTAEVSEALGRHPAVQDANVFGIQIPHYEGRAGCAAVLFDREVDEALLADVAEHAKRNLPKYAVPLFLRVTREVVATGNNKQQKHVLRAEGADPGKVSGGDRMFWLKGGKRYVAFEERDWRDLEGQRVKL